MRELVEEMTTFAVVASNGSFTQTAVELGKSKAYVSTQIARLEKALGTHLLFRSPRKVTLTEAGQILLPHCQRMLSEAELARSALLSLQGGISGTIRVSVPLSLSSVVSQWLTPFQREHPHIRIHLEAINQTENLKDSMADFAFRATEKVQDQDYVAIFITDFQYKWYASKEYVQQYGHPQSPLELSHHNGLYHSQVDANSSWPFRINDQIQFHAANDVLSSNSAETLYTASKNHSGIVRIPSYLVQEGELVCLFSAFETAPTPIHLVYPYQGTLPVRHRYFVDYMKSLRASTLVKLR